MKKKILFKYLMTLKWKKNAHTHKWQHRKKISITHIHNTQTLKTVFIMEKRRK